MSDVPDQEPDELPDDETELPDSFHRERREHGGASEHLNDDQLARLTEEERKEAGLEDHQSHEPE
jgi:hypothetical protein